MPDLFFVFRKNISLNSRVATLIFPFLFTFLNCGNTKNSVANNQEIILNKHPKILFINYQANKKSNDTIVLKLLNKIVTEGRVKEKPRYKRLKNDDWECFQLDENKNVLQHFFLDNPFFKQVEYLNDQGEFETRTLEFDSVQIPIRLQLHKDSKFVTLRSFLKNKSGNPIELKTAVE